VILLVVILSMMMPTMPASRNKNGVSDASQGERACVQAALFAKQPGKPASRARGFGPRGCAKKSESITQMTGVRNNWVLLFF
jgi:hypothetical protein